MCSSIFGLDHRFGQMETLRCTQCRGEPCVRPRTKNVCEQLFEGEHKVRPYIVAEMMIKAQFSRNDEPAYF